MVRSIKGDGTLAFTTIGDQFCQHMMESIAKYILATEKFILVHFYQMHQQFMFMIKQEHLKEIQIICISLDEVVKTKDDVLKLGINSGDFIAIDLKLLLLKMILLNLDYR